MVNVGIFSLDAALSHTEPGTEDLNTENQLQFCHQYIVTSGIYFIHTVTHRPVTDLNCGVLYITTLLICSMRQKLCFIPLKYCFIPTKIPFV